MDQNIAKQFFQKENLYLVSPYVSRAVEDKILRIWKETEYQDHVFLMSSGTTSTASIKTYVLSKESIINNCKSVNSFFGIDEKQVFLGSLPFYHIGGLSILIRAKLAGAKVYPFNSSWNVQSFINAVDIQGISCCSLVPTQLYDIIRLGVKAPRTLKMVFIGGDFLNSELAKQALVLGWPIIVTYGMTENASQVASGHYKELKNEHIPILPGNFIYKKDDKYWLKSQSLFSECINIFPDYVEFSKQTGDLALSDNISLIEESNLQWLKPLGRSDDFFKIKGRLYNYLELKDIWLNELFQQDVLDYVEIIAVDDPREGKVLQALYLAEVALNIDDILNGINLKLPEPITIRSSQLVKRFDRTALGKLKNN